MTKPIVWTIAASDSGGGAGIQADLHTMQALNVHGCSVITAVTAQNSVEINDIFTISSDSIAAQINALHTDLPAQAIKLGVLGSSAAMMVIAQYLKTYHGYVIYDPVLMSTTGTAFLNSTHKDLLIQHILPHVDVLTPNIAEAEFLTGMTIQSYEDIEKAADQILTLGVNNVLITGGHTNDHKFSQDYWTNSKGSCWLAQQRLQHDHHHGSGCTLSSAIAASLALGHDIKNAIVIAKMYTTQGIRQAIQIGQGAGSVAHRQWPESIDDLPIINNQPITTPQANFTFPSMSDDMIDNIYPLVDSAVWVEKLLSLGVKTIQLRIKDQTDKNIEHEIKQAVQLANDHNATLFINDYWELAIKHHAQGVHLGQDDLLTADLNAIANAGLYLGLSTHNYFDLAKIYWLRPSYVACGPIFPTKSKIFSYAPVGVDYLQRCRQLVPCPLIAIGGINQNNLSQILATGVRHVAVISAVTKANKPEIALQQFNSIICSV